MIVQELSKAEELMSSLKCNSGCLFSPCCPRLLRFDSADLPAARLDQFPVSLCSQEGRLGISSIILLTKIFVPQVLECQFESVISEESSSQMCYLRTGHLRTGDGARW